MNIANIADRRRLPLLTLLVANTVSLVGSSLTAVALPWLILETTGSASRAGLIAFAVTFPRLLAGVFGGTIVDRLGVKLTSVVADTISGVCVGLIPLMFEVTGQAFWPLFALVFAANLLTIPGSTARRAVVPELSGLADARLERVNSAFESVQYLTRLIAAPTGGALIAIFGATTVLWIDAATFLLSAGLVGRFVPDVAPRIVTSSGGTGYWSQLVDGFRFLRNDRLLLWMAGALLISNAFALALGPVFLPVYASVYLESATGLGVMIAGIGAGGVVGSMLYGAVGYRFPRRTMWLLAFVVAPVEYWVLLGHPSLAVVTAAMFLAGFVFGPFNPVMMTVRQERVPLAMRGRVFSLFSALTIAAQPVGVVVAGVLIDTVGFDASVLLFAVALQTLGIALLFVPVLHGMNVAPAPLQTESSATKSA